MRTTYSVLIFVICTSALLPVRCIHFHHFYIVFFPFYPTFSCFRCKSFCLFYCTRHPSNDQRPHSGLLIRLMSFTAKTKLGKFETNIPRKGISGPQSQFPHSCVCERIIYSHDGSACSAGGNMYKLILGIYKSLKDT